MTSLNIYLQEYCDKPADNIPTNSWLKPDNRTWLDKQYSISLLEFQKGKR
jgi:hypothetical protein